MWNKNYQKSLTIFLVKNTIVTIQKYDNLNNGYNIYYFIVIFLYVVPLFCQFFIRNETIKSENNTKNNHRRGENNDNEGEGGGLVEFIRRFFGS